MDWSGQELRLAADASQDENMLSCYIGDNLRDPHSITGAAIAAKQGSKFGDYNKFVKNVKKDEVAVLRGLGKGVNFSSQYLCRAAKLAKLLVTDEASAQQYLDAKNETYQGLTQWQQDTIARAKQNGYALTRLGAKRHLAEAIRSHNKYDAAKAERRAVNYEIQGSAAEMTKLAIKDMIETGHFHQDYAFINFPVHDELVFEAPVEEADRVTPMIREEMEGVYPLKVPLKVDIHRGANWDEAH